MSGNRRCPLPPPHPPLNWLQRSHQIGISLTRNMLPENKIRAAFIANFLSASSSHDRQPGISFLIYKCKRVLNVAVDPALTGEHFLFFFSQSQP